MIKRAIIAPVLLLLGVYLFLNPGGSGNAGTIFAIFWPTLFIIPLSLFLHWMVFSLIGRQALWLVVPGGILLVSGLTCQIAQMFGLWHVMWPGFILAVFSIDSVLSSFVFVQPLVAMALVLGGGWLIFNRKQEW